MSSIDHLLQRLRKQEAKRPTDSLARFVVTKLSWRGSYKRILSITPSAVVTQYADTLSVTNSWAYAGDHDLAAIEVGGEHAEGGIFTLHFRRDKKVGRACPGGWVGGGCGLQVLRSGRTPPWCPATATVCFNSKDYVCHI
jgi:hypothetical protein